jgi:hypothetical protein
MGYGFWVMGFGLSILNKKIKTMVFSLETKKI